MVNEKKSVINNKLVIAVIIPILITSSLQAYGLFELNNEVNRLNELLGNESSSKIILPKYSSSTLKNQGCNNQRSIPYAVY